MHMLASTASESTYAGIAERLGMTPGAVKVAVHRLRLAVFALIFRATATLGFGFMQSLLMYIVIVVVGLLIQMFVVFPILLGTLGGVNPWWFFRNTSQVIVTAFSMMSVSVYGL